MRRRRRLTTLAFLALLATAATAEARSVTVRFPRFSVPPHSDREVCTFVRVPAHKALDLAGSSVVNVGGKPDFVTHHFIMWAYTGQDIGAFQPGKVVDSKACLDFGPTDSSARVLLRTAQRVRSIDMVPAGLAERIEPATEGHKKVIGLILNSHWINSSDKVQHASVVVKLIPAKPHSVRRYLRQIFEATACAFIDVAPGGVSTAAKWSWGPNVPNFGSTIFAGAEPPKGTACVSELTTHMHKRGKLFTIEVVDSDGSSRELYHTTQYSEPADVPLGAPLVIQPGQSLRYTCMHDNGQTTAQRLGCEEEAGVPPGKPPIQTFFTPVGIHGAAKRCQTDADCPATDAAYPGRSFTGHCVPARLVFGFTSDDDMCILPGEYYDAVAGAPPGSECDLSSLPIIN